MTALSTRDALRTWRHPVPFESPNHSAQPDMTRCYFQPGTGNLEAPCLGCSMAVICVAAVVDAATLADDEALNRSVAELQGLDPELDGIDWRDRIEANTETFRALATALAERSQP